MRKSLACLVVVLAVPALAAASGVEITGLAGYTFPLYSQTFSYDSGPVSVEIPGVSIQQSGTFEMRGSGGPVFGGALSLFPAEAIGFELRLDRGEFTVASKSPTYDVRATLPAPLAPISTTLSLVPGEAVLKSPTPFSLNLKLRTPGPTRVFVSGGLSYLREMSFSIEQSVALGVTAVNLQTSNLEIATVGFRARRRPGDPKKNWGANGGIGFEVALGDRGALVFEGRGFYFPKQTFEWEPIVETPLGNVEALLLPRVKERLEPVDFQPWWVQATVGISYRF